MNVHQQQVAQGGTIRASKTWRNTGGAGFRDIYVAYGTGETLEAFLMEFGAVAVDRYCAAGVEVTTPVDCQVPEDATSGLKNALVGVGKYTGTAMTFDDYDIVPDAIEVLPTVTPPAPNIIAENLEITPKEIWLGESVAIKFDVTNYGDAAGTAKVYVDLRGDYRETEVTLSPGEIRELTYTVTPRYIGQQKVSVYVDGVKALEGEYFVWGSDLRLSWTMYPGRWGVGTEGTYEVAVRNKGNVGAYYTIEGYLTAPNGIRRSILSDSGYCAPEDQPGAWAQYQVPVVFEMVGTYIAQFYLYWEGETRMISTETEVF